MQIPQNVINMLSAKGKGYIEAVMKIAQGQKLVDEGTIEIAALDGRALAGGGGRNAGGTDVLATVRLIAASPTAHITSETVRALLREGNKTTVELAKAINRSVKRTREIVKSIKGVTNVGTGNKMCWSLATAATTKHINKRSTILDKTARRTPHPSAAQRNSSALAANSDQQKADENKIVELLKEEPGLSVTALMKKLERSFYPVARAIKNLVRVGRLKPTTTKNARNCTRQTWVPVAHGA